MEATWERLHVLEGVSTALKTYWVNIYNDAIPCHLPWTHNECLSAWSVQTPEYISPAPELDPDGFLTPIPGSDYTEPETCYTLPSLDKSELES